MRNLLEKQNKGLTEDAKRLLKFMTVPLVVVILVIIIVLLDQSGKKDKKGPETVTEESGAADEMDKIQESSETSPEITLSKEAVPVIHDLMEAYFKARRTCDADALSALYGGTCGQEALHNQRIKMENEVEFYQSFNNLVCYTAPGLEEGDYVVFAEYEIKFRQADTLAPGMIVCYVKTAPDGSCYLVAETSAEQSSYMETAGRLDQAQALQENVNQRLSDALKADENLLAVYHTLLDGEEQSAGEPKPEEKELIQ